MLYINVKTCRSKVITVRVSDSVRWADEHSSLSHHSLFQGGEGFTANKVQTLNRVLAKTVCVCVCVRECAAQAALVPVYILVLHMCKQC